MSSDNRIPLMRPRARLEEKVVWGAGAPHPLIDARAESPACLNAKLRVWQRHLMGLDECLSNGVGISASVLEQDPEGSGSGSYLVKRPLNKNQQPTAQSCFQRAPRSQMHHEQIAQISQ